MSAALTFAALTPVAVMLAVAVFLAAPNAVRAGAITGIVTAKGPDATEEGPAAGGGSYGSRRYKFAEKIDYDRLEDFVVYIDEPGGDPHPGSPATIVQKDVSFEPHVLAIAAGTLVRWPNLDDIYHNVFTYSDAGAGPFDLGTYLKERVPEIAFTRTGQVDVFCSIHSRMHCIILVLPTGHFAKVNAGQRYTLRDVPAGNHHLKVWHERLPPAALDLSVPADGEVRADVTMGVAVLPRR